MPHPHTGGGSRKGKPNRAKVAFREALQQYCDSIGLNPFYQMAHLAMDPDAEAHLRFLALKELCQYLEPKLRAVVLTSDPDNPLTVVSQVKTSLSQAFDLAYGPADHTVNGQARPHRLPAPRR